MLRHKATIQALAWPLGSPGITDEDEAIATPGLAAKDVTPKAARNVPLDPLPSLPARLQTIEAETEVVHDVAEPTQEDMLKLTCSKPWRILTRKTSAPTSSKRTRP